MRRIVRYFPESNTAPLEEWETEITENEIEELKEIAHKYSNTHIYTNTKGNLCIDYGRYSNEIVTR